VDVDVKARSLGEHGYEVSLVLRAEASREGATAFLVEVEYAGIFQLNGVPSEAVEPVLLIECPRILFPYARAIVSGATQDGGYAPLLVNPIDFAQLYRAQRMRQGPTATA
jgi:preprotein translocase subunit SecB